MPAALPSGWFAERGGAANVTFRLGVASAI